MDTDDTATHATAAAGTAAPPAGWYPHPADPSRELYWDGSTWVADTTRPLVTAAAAPTVALPYAQQAAFGTPSYASVPTGQLPAGPLESPAKAAAPSFLLGVAVAVGVSLAGLWVIQSHSGGILWLGGYIVSFGAWRRSWAYYRAAAARTGQTLSAPQKAITGILLVVSLALTAAFVVQYIGQKTAPKLTAGVGSCWAQEGDKGVLVDCTDSRAAYIAVSTASTTDQCPTNDAVQVDSLAYCLRAK